MRNRVAIFMQIVFIAIAIAILWILNPILPIMKKNSKTGGCVYGSPGRYHDGNGHYDWVIPRFREDNITFS